MIAVRWVVRPIGICVMRRHEPDSPAVFCNAVKLADESHHIGNVLGDVPRNDKIEFAVGKGIRNRAQIVNDISRRPRIVVQAD